MVSVNQSVLYEMVCYWRVSTQANFVVNIQKLTLEPFYHWIECMLGILWWKWGERFLASWLTVAITSGMEHAFGICRERSCPVIRFSAGGPY